MAGSGEQDIERRGRWLRLLDLAPGEDIVVSCACGQIREFPNGYLQRRYRIPSDTLVYDLQFRLRCHRCRSQDAFDIIVAGPRSGDMSKPRTERVIVRRRA